MTTSQRWTRTGVRRHVQQTWALLVSVYADIGRVGC